jgi:hypothetical protein
MAMAGVILCLAIRYFLGRHAPAQLPPEVGTEN